MSEKINVAITGYGAIGLFDNSKLCADDVKNTMDVMLAFTRAQKKIAK